MTPPPRVLVVDDSRLMTRIISTELAKRGIDVVGVAHDGVEALERVAELRPDALTLDMMMPNLDGAGVVAKLQELATPPLVVIASAYSHADAAVELLTKGAADLVAKPKVGEPLDVFIDQLATALRGARPGAAGSTSAPRPTSASTPSFRSSGDAIARRAPASGAGAPRAADERGAPVLFIACSTGGPKALAALIPHITSAPAGGIIVQHMPAGFTASLARRLDGMAADGITVREAADGDRLAPGLLLLAPGGRHMHVSHGTIRITDEEAVGGLRPRADVTLEDASAEWGRRLRLAVLTGVGDDGTAGARHVRAYGGRVLSEAEGTCTVYGMPRAVAAAGLVDRVEPLDRMAAALGQELRDA